MNLLNNRYRILKQLGAGGFGNTYLAEDTQMPSQRCCVIKQLKPVTYNPEVYQLIQERFAREAAVLEKLGENSPQIPRLYAYFSEDNQFYLIQEWIEGITLTKKVQQSGVLHESAVREILISLLSVLDFVHRQGIVHRDIKPDNIILRSSDGKPVLIDFGAVRETLATQLNSQGETTSSIVIGTPGFMPAEQAAGRPVYSSDLYSLGLTGIYLLTGKMPQQLVTDPVSGEIIWDKQGINPQLASILEKAARSHPRDRFATAQGMLEALQTTSVPISEPTVPFIPQSGNYEPTVQYIPKAPVDTPPATARNNSNAIIVGSSIAIGLIGAAAVVGLLSKQSPSPTPISSISTTSPTTLVTPATSSPVGTIIASSPTPTATVPAIQPSPDCAELLSSNLGQYQGKSTIINSQKRISGKIEIDINRPTNSSCTLMAKLEEFEPLGGKGTLDGKLDPNASQQVDLTGTLSHQTQPKVWDVEMKLRFTSQDTIEGQTTWKPKSGIADSKIYYEEFTATKSTVVDSSDRLPYFMVRPITQADLAGKSQWELDLIRNEIFARYGRRFNRQDLQAYFDRQPWYTPKYDPDNFPQDLLTPVQKRNILFITRYQKQ